MRRSLAVLLLIPVATAAAKSTCNNTDSYYFNVQPKGITVREGGRAFLECNVSNRCSIKFQWSIDEEIIQNTTRRYQNGSNLIITRVNRTLDNGVFHCLATLTSTGISKESRPATLSILWLEPNATTSLHEGDVAALETGTAEQMTLKCNVQGSEDGLEYRWFWNGQRLKRRLNNRDEDDETLPTYFIDYNLLAVQKPTIADNGLYACVAENAAGVTQISLGYQLSVKDPSLPRLSERPEPALTKAGGRARLRCDWLAAASVTWTRPNGTPLPDRATMSGDTLTIESVEASDAGWYTCVAEATNASGKAPAQSSAAQLVIASLAEFDKATALEPISALYAVGVGKRFQLACIPPPGFPAPDTYWTRNGVRLPDTGRLRAEGVQLVIESAEADDAGGYECLAENLAGQRKTGFSLYVSRPPTLERHPMSRDEAEGKEAVFSCAYKGSPYPVSSVEWEQDGEPLQRLTEEDRRRINYTPSGDLTITDLRLEDQGSYVCIVRTADQSPVRSRAAELSVRENLKWDPRPPVNQRLREGQNAQVACKAKGNKTPVVKWLKVASIGLDGTVQHRYSPPMKEFPPNIRDKDGTLYIQSVAFDDAGEYICVAASPQGVINKTITIEVSVPPEFYLVPAAEQTVLEGADVWLHCGARGTPLPTLDWFFESTEMSNWDFSNYQKFANNSLVIRGVKARANAGTYSCMAGNKGGLERRTALLCVRQPLHNLTYCGPKGGIRRGQDSPIQMEETGASGLKSTTIAIAVGAAGGYILLVICLVSWCAYRRRQGLAKLQEAADASAGPLVAPVDVSAHSHHHHSMGERQSGASPGQGGYRHSPRSGVSSSKQSSLERIGFSRENIDLGHMAHVGSGVFGDVYVAPVATPDGLHNALLKALLVRDDALHQQLRDEMELFSRTDHPHVAKLIGICREREPIYVVYQYAPLNLKHYLVYSRPGRVETEGKPPLLSLSQIISIVYQVAQGMEHISDLRFVHKDLAARNIILDENLTARVASLSMQNSPFLSEYYVYHNITCPLRWIPAEALFDDDWSMKSDVWSFGVFVWELLSVGELPYITASNDEVIEGLKDDSLRLTLPPFLPIPSTEPIPTPDSLARLLKRCWKASPRDRPTFTEIRDVIGALHVETNC